MFKSAEEDTLINIRSQPGADDGVVRRASIVVLAGPRAGAKVPLNEAVVIGRSAGCSLRIDQRGVSRRHARIARTTEGAYQIEDLSSRNGTFVNGEAVSERLLQVGDRIQIGPRVTLLFTLKDPMEDQIHQAQKMEAIGRLSAGITHDFNNLLSVLSANLDFLRGMPANTTLSNEDVRDCLSELETATQRATELTGRLASFVRREEDQYQPVNISDLCREVVRLLKRVLPSSIEVKTAIKPNLIVNGSRAHLHQMLMNPCINARDAMPGGGTLTVRAAMAKSGGQLPGLNTEEPHVLIQIEDTGIGMDEETLSHAFDPFFTTKGEQLGTGLGLATVRKISREHGGLADVTSAKGAGTTVRIAMPASQQQHQATLMTVEGDRTGPLPKVGARVLVVDDEGDVARSAGRLLERSGYIVSYAYDGRDALDRYAEDDPPDLILLDIDMPKMGGRECYQHLRRLDPNVRVLFVSGQWADQDEQALRSEGAKGLLRKPLVDARLQAAVSAALSNG